MLLTLESRSFRNLEPLTFRPGAGPHLLLGDNGAGKTSLLEAIYVLATTKSFRTSQISDCARHGAGYFHLQGEVERPSGARARLEVGWRADGAGSGSRQRSVNGNDTPLADHLEILSVVAWTADDAEVLTGAPALRRRFLDRGVVSTRPGAIAALTRYRRTLQQKRDLLAAPGRAGDAELASWNGVLAAAAAEVLTLRAAYVERLAGRLEEVLEQAALSFPAVELRYRPSPGVEPDALADRRSAEDAVLRRLERAAGGERRRGMPLVGPHRDDLEILWGGHPVKATVSAGERKALSLLLTAAHGRALAAADREPTFLLDDLDAELAEGTLARVWTVFTDARQLLATSNRPAVWRGIDVRRRSHLAAGVVSEETA